ncbi:DUF3278 domain-containing protein [Virgibacillus halophilus]|uniref:DUF3278 domain-containing protein n=1 Tax=Tigheibacillus halophilus TaxID=361280 RepID=UPI00362B7811
MKSWICFLLPDDEYKQQKMLYFYSEGAIILVISLIIMMICNTFFNLDAGIVLLSSIAIFLFYITARYIVSGIEYTDVATEKAFKKELKVIFVRVISFVVIFALMYIIWSGVPDVRSEWLNMIGLLLSVGLIWFFSSFISLKRSFKKNRDLL